MIGNHVEAKKSCISKISWHCGGGCYFFSRDVALQGVVDSNERQPRSTNNRPVCACKPIPFPLFVGLLVLMTIISLVGLIVLPILSVILTGVPYSFAFCFPAQFVILGWAFTVGFNWSWFFFTYLGRYWLPLPIFCLFGNF
jgi:uncharacterized membrane protein